jgi:hypothetical protein
MTTFAEGILITALEGGIGYWSFSDDVVTNSAGDYVSATICPNYETEGDFEPGVVRAADLERAAVLLRDSGSLNGVLQGYLATALRDRDAGMIDADLADCIVQFALLGEVVFG